MTLTLVPFPVDLSSSVALAESALRARLAPGEEFAPQFAPIVAEIRSSHATGGILSSDGEFRGMVLWEPAGPLGVSVRLLYLSPRHAHREGYGAVLDLAERTAGPVVFAPGPLAGLSTGEESELMHARGFVSFGRSEMEFPPSTPVPPVAPPSGSVVRPVRPDDEPALARLHEKAYRNHLDRYFALETWDPKRDADRQLRAYFEGRFGELLSPGSSVAALASDGRVVAAVLAVRGSSRVLLIDVVCEPERQGKGFGRAALTAALHALRGRGASRIVLNVTEENAPALRLYTGLGFVRTIGPSKEWYNARRLPVDFPPSASR